MHIFQTIYTLLLSPLTFLANRININVKNCMLSLCSAGLVGYFIFYFSPECGIRSRLTLDHIIGGVLLLFLILSSIQCNLRLIKWNRAVFYTFFLSGIGIFAISYLHPIGDGYRAFSLMMMVEFPCLYFVWNNRGDYGSLYKRLSAATALVGMLYYIYCFKISSQGKLGILSNRVKGSFYDSNMFSMLGMIMVCAALYMILVNRNSIAWLMLTSISLGVGISIVRLGVSRLSILVILGSSVAFLIFYMKNYFSISGTKKNKIARAIIMLVIVIICVLSGNLLLHINERSLEEKSISEAPTITDTETAAIEEPSKDSSTVTERFKIEGRDLDSYTAGRYHIWKGYAQFLNLTGNDFDKADWRALTWNKVKHAHNNFLEIAYRCGIPVACVHIFLELIAGIVCLIWLFSPKYKKPEYMFCIAFMISYTVQSLFDIATTPFERPAPFYFYMSMIPIFTFGTTKSDLSNGAVSTHNVR